MNNKNEDLDIISLPIEMDYAKIDSRFRLVNIAAQRAREIALGAKKRVETRFKKPATIAICEAISGKLEYITGEEARKAREEEKKLIDYRKILEERRRVPEDIKELERDLKVYVHSKEETMDLNELFSNQQEGAEE